MPKIKDNINANNDLTYSEIEKNRFILLLIDYIYVIGCWLIRLFRFYKRKIIVFTKITFTKIKNNFIKLKINIRKYIYSHFIKLLKPSQTLAKKIEVFEHLLSTLGSSKSYKKRKIFVIIIKSIFRNIFYYFSLIYSYIVPICATVFLVFVIKYYDNAIYALNVEYNGKNIGYINTESEFYVAETLMRERIIHESYKKPIDIVPRFTLAKVDKEQI